LKILILLSIGLVLVLVFFLTRRESAPLAETVAEDSSVAVAPTEASVAGGVPVARKGVAAAPAEVKPSADVQALLSKGDTAGAIKLLEAKLTENPSDQFSLETLGKLYAKDPRQRDKAEVLLKKALEGNPENRETLEEYLGTQRNSSKPGGPLSSLQQLMEENPTSPNIAGAYARTLAHKGQTQEAIAVMERAIENPEADAFAFHTLSEMYRKSGEPNKAADAFERALQRQQERLSDLRSKNQPVDNVEKAITRTQALLAGELIRSRQIDRAEAAIRTLEQKDPNHSALQGLRQDLERAKKG